VCGRVSCGFGGVILCCVWDSLVWVWGREVVVCVGEFGVGMGERMFAACGKFSCGFRGVSLCFFGRDWCGFEGVSVFW